VTLDPTLAAAEKNLAAVGLAPTPEDPCDLVADKGYHSRDVLKDLDDSPWQTRIAEPLSESNFGRISSNVGLTD
jgi:transposase